MKNYERKSDEDLKQIAMDLVEGKIFYDRQLDHASQLRNVFIPVWLGRFDNWTDEIYSEIGVVYEYLEKASPREMLGELPVFGSM